MATTERLRAYDGAPLFSYGFRPFFLGASVWAAFSVTIWITSLTLGHADIGGRSGLDWHMDEMMFGFLPAVFAGFLLTAVPNWTGRRPVLGPPLAALFALWVAGRGANLASSALGPVAGILDIAFLFALAALIWREIVSAGNRRNLPVCLMVTGLAIAHLAYHLRDTFPLIEDIPQRAALSLVAGMIALIGGRIVPSFTRNWLAAQGRPTRASAASASLDRIGLAVLGVALAAWVIAPDVVWTGAALCVAGGFTLARLSRWNGLSTLREPLVWILHAGYAWLGIALALIGLSIVASGLVPRSAGIHALTTGAAGVMVLAVMSRASLGHTGRALTANRITSAIYGLINLAALVRTASPFMGDAYIPLLIASAIVWVLAFGGFAAAYGPLLCSPRAPKADAGTS